MVLKVKNRRFARNVLTLLTGTTVAQALPIAISPILTRIYTPNDFGIFGIYFAIFMVLSVASTGKYELAIMLPEKDEDAINIFVVGTIICTLFSLLTLIFIFIFYDQIILAFKNETVSSWLYFIPLSVFLVGIFNLLNYFNNRKQYYRDISTAMIYKAIVNCGAQLSLGVFAPGPNGLIVGQVLSQSFSNIKLVKNVISQKSLISAINKQRVIHLFIKYRKFPKYSLPSDLLNSASTQLPIIFFAYLFNSSIVGFYALAQRVISMPVTLIATSIGQVFFRDASSLSYDMEKFSDLTSEVYSKLLYISVVPFSLLIIFSEQIFQFAFGKNWLVAGQYSQVLSCWMLFVFIGSPLSTIVSILGRQKQLLYFNSALFFARFLALLTGGIILNDAYSTITLYALVGCIFWLGWIIYLLRTAFVPILPLILRTGFIVFATLILFQLVEISYDKYQTNL